jgi:uncharacterized coiled-coil DUF342 family protein
VVRRKSLSELEHAEIKLQSLMDRRMVLNQEANVLRQERDLVHERKRELLVGVRELRARRAALIAEVRRRRQERDAFQQQAKALIDGKRKLRGQGGRSAGEELRAIRRQVSEMEMRQQTATLSLSQENRLLDDLKGMLRRLRDLEVLKADEDRVAKEVRNLDATITDLFASADRAHKAAAEASDAARALDGDLDQLLAGVRILAAEGDQHHAAYLEAKTKADEVHGKVVAMREKVLTSRDAARAERREARDLLRAQNRSVRHALLDPKKLEESADEALQSLLKKGRVEIGR